MTKKSSRKYKGSRVQKKPASVKKAPVVVKDKSAELVEEYRYVLGDLKRIGVLAAAMFTLLVVLALVIG